MLAGSTKPIEVFNAYNGALMTGDMPALAKSFADDIAWHQPGNHPLSGDHHGRDAVLRLFGDFMQRCGGTFRVETREAMANGDLVAASVHFSAQRGDQSLDMNGVDLFRIRDGRIVEVWLFSADQITEDAFWS